MRISTCSMELSALETSACMAERSKLVFIRNPARLTISRMGASQQIRRAAENLLLREYRAVFFMVLLLRFTEKRLLYNQEPLYLSYSFKSLFQALI